MLNSNDLADLYRDLVPGTEAVTYLSRQPVPANPENTFSSTSLSYAKREPASEDFLMALGADLTTRALTWKVWARDLGAVVPKRGDRITDGNSVTYEVLRVPRAAKLMGNAWDLDCLQDVT